jgi:hypothetical protein
MAAGRYDIVCEQGATFIRELTWTDATEQPVNLTGYSARMHVRQTIKSATTVIELTTANGRVVLYPTTGKIVMTLTAEQTAALPTKPCVYDLELVSGSGVVTRLIEGSFTVKPEVTR